MLINTLDTLDQHLDQYSINILIDTRSTFYWHSINSHWMVGWVSTNSYESIKSLLNSSQPTVDWDVNGGVDGVSIKYRLRVSQEYQSRWWNDWHLTKFCLHLILRTGSGNHTLGNLNHPVTSIIYVTTAFLCVFLGLVTQFRYNRLVAWYW